MKDIEEIKKLVISRGIEYAGVDFDKIVKDLCSLQSSEPNQEVPSERVCEDCGNPCKDCACAEMNQYTKTISPASEEPQEEDWIENFIDDIINCEIENGEITIEDCRKSLLANLPRTDEKEVEIEKKSLLEIEGIYHITECNVCKNEVQARDHYCPGCSSKIKWL